jgi:hypothetical protein
MTDMENTMENSTHIMRDASRLKLQITEQEYFSAEGDEVNGLTHCDASDKALKTTALILFLTAVISQWALGFYVADSYSHPVAVNGLPSSNSKARNVEIPDKNFMNINFSCATFLRSKSAVNTSMYRKNSPN